MPGWQRRKILIASQGAEIMAKDRIKGITIEIDGDVTKLDKALSKTNRSVKDTQTQLKDIEKLLKFDPKNIELLDQKQRLLAKSAEETAEKYRILKEALDNSTASNVKYAEWEKAQASLQGQITKTENELTELLKTQKQYNDLGFPVDSPQMAELQSQIEGTKEKLQNLNDTVTKTYEELGRPINIEQYDALQRELSEATKEMEDAEKAAKNFSPALEKVAASAQEVSDKAGKVADSTKGLSLAAAGVVAGLGAMAISAGKTADDLNTLSQQSGFSTETLQTWNYAADRIDVDVDTMIKAATKMKKNMDSSSADVQEAWARLGVSVRDGSGQFRNAEDVFNDTVFMLSKVANETERDTLAMTLFGKSADQLAGVIDDGGAALQYFGQEAKDAGLILSQEALDGANKFNDGIDELKAKAQAAFLEAGAALATDLLPMLEKLGSVITNVLGFIAKLDPKVIKIVGGIALLVAAISPIAKMISNISGAISGVSNVAKLFSAGAGNSVWTTFSKWALVIVAVVTALTLLIAAISVLTGKSNEMTRTFNSISGTTSGAVGNINGMPRGYADGGVFAPNSPILGIFGDNRNEREIAAPESALIETFNRALDSRGGAGTNVTVKFTGSLSQLGRILAPVVTIENGRQGPNLIKG